MDNLFFEHLFERFKQLKVAVIGDLMLDIYWWGNVDRISPEAPVPIVSLQQRENRLGGAGNVALNLRSLGAKVEVFSVVGDDEQGQILHRLLEENKISTKGIFKSMDRLTTSKTRIISRNQQMLRLDAEDTHDLNADDEIDFLNIFLSRLESDRPDVVILQDYNKGVLTDHVIQQVIVRCNALGVHTCVDPKQKNFYTYREATIFKPNLKEVKEGLQVSLPIIDQESMRQIHQQLQERLSHQISLVTLSEKGLYYCLDGQGAIVPSHLRNISDVSGAGDTVIAVAALVWAATQDVSLMAEIANIAGGLVCEEVGVVAIQKEHLLAECNLLLKGKMLV
ncbi:MAG: bifunctional heptose 7-phosphate kinase/heptose 1-phosphate adenyltransferase [Chitinophagaceae bacterium]